jgi:ABC-type amino acid transport substrate-binding protein/serine phosphatase RsbU (regulator of sigma subunit)
MRKACLLLVFFVTYALHAKTFTVSYDPDYAPFSSSRNGKPYGLFIDIWKLWAKTNHHTITFIQGKDWDDAIEMAHTGKADFFLGTTPYEAWMQASIPYYETQASLFALKSFKAPLHVIGIVGDDYKEDILKRFPGSKVLSYDDYTGLMDALLAQKVDAIYDDSVAINYFAIENNYIHRIKKLTAFIMYSKVDAISADAKKIALFNEGFKKIPQKALIDTEKNWIFSKEERYYRSHFINRTLTYVYDPDWKPFEYTDPMTHKHMGIIADILGLIESKTGIKLEPVQAKSWNDSIDLVKSGKADMVSAVPYSKKKAAYLTFTNHDIYSYPAVLLSSRKETDMPPIDGFSDRSIGIIRGNTLGQWVMQHFPKSKFVIFKGMDDAITALENGKIDFFAINGVTALYYINALGHKNIYIDTTLEYTFHLKIGFRKSVPEGVISIIDEALGQISEKEKSDIYHKWVSVKVQKETNWKLLGIILLIALGVLLILYIINQRLKSLVAQKTQELKAFNEQLEETVQERTNALHIAHENLEKNIQYASLIQHAILPKEEEMARFFKSCFILWEPKDIVGGDIYFFQRLNEKEAYLFVIDCTGHGVSGAFITMLLKALKVQLFTVVSNTTVTPSSALSFLNKSMKQLLQQKEMDSNVGLDAAVVYINKAEHLLAFAGANIPLFYEREGSIEIVNADRYSVGYTGCDDNYQYSEHSIALKKGMRFYLTSDGFIDQNGGEKGFPLGKNRFIRIIEKCRKIPISEQKPCFKKALLTYQGDEVRNDDIVLIGFEV